MKIDILCYIGAVFVSLGIAWVVNWCMGRTGEKNPQHGSRLWWDVGLQTLDFSEEGLLFPMIFFCILAVCYFLPRSLKAMVLSSLCCGVLCVMAHHFLRSS
ncbi:MAG: hypothetical protein JWM68_4238 [Verrucomicrobiales bacterium]|nr:hypothetical protein [Verrucomicrobiales bacterium]